ncbi:hypothetical protein TNCT_314431 [Trichonephila clavata]|uniref:Uncharacterized protein n=1 Tax=Trichonephila clavata TaxID=2740835 RepID=A0A8X6J1Y1_TRICU|nr:hypothetical protein TNCT_314431 [Trichonephila clavata]
MAITRDIIVGGWRVLVIEGEDTISTPCPVQLHIGRKRVEKVIDSPYIETILVCKQIAHSGRQRMNEYYATLSIIDLSVIIRNPRVPIMVCLKSGPGLVKRELLLKG